MQSFSSASSWQSLDSLSSSHSFLFSETEDEADVFLSEGEARLAPGVFAGLAGSPLKRDLAGRRPGTPRVILVSPCGGVKPGGQGQTEGDFAFAQKCAELQGFVRPLRELLNGLKRGKYDRGLSSFQQSVAMDRIQRIVGVLQNPSMGERHLHTLLQVEMMLKLWFPQVSPAPTPPPSLTPPILTENVPRSGASRWRRDQLNIPMKKRRLSWTALDSTAQLAPACKRLQQERPEAAERGPAGPEERGRHCEKEALGDHLSSRLTPVPLPSEKTAGGRAENSAPSVTPAGSPATQEAYVSSTTPLSPTLDPTALRPQPTRCLSEPIAAETEGGRGWPSETSQKRSLSLPRLTKNVNTPEQ